MQNVWSVDGLNRVYKEKMVMVEHSRKYDLWIKNDDFTVAYGFKEV